MKHHSLLCANVLSLMALFWSSCFAANLCLDGPPVKTSPSECCETPALIDPPIMMDCFQKWGEQTKRQSRMEGIPRGCCVAECAMNATKLLTGGKINRKEMKKIFLASANSTPQWKPIVKKTLEECLKQADGNKEEIEAGAKLLPSYEGEKICHPISGNILRCMRMKLFTKCPAGIFRGGSDCDQLKQYHAACPLN
ncbi:general odorant-binding protein 68-like [Toxorhynchites rutilus septentrionalis]|uniref:general odorant-binding protein 68-like n=1 Tax=Toxorhynchites rutilus septentrionalis TaxID=329112 RepID=UPI002478EE4A|nr:general odorant-binding protein 68-like [Toxorhynchites rutilus septentrionalis]